MNRGKTWAVLIPAMTLPFLSSLFYFIVFRESTATRVLYGATKVFTLVWPAVCLLWIFRERWPALNLRDPRHLRALPLGLVSGGAIAILMFALMQTSIGDLVRESAPRIRAKTESMGFLSHFLFAALALSVLHSLLEEYYWRWFIFGRLRSVANRWLAHVLAGLAFASHHVVVTTQFFPLAMGLVFGSCVAVGGMIWSLLYERQGTLAGAWVSHIVADLAIMTIGWQLLFK